MEDLIKKAIQVKSIEETSDKVTLLEELQGNQKYPTKYSFFKKKRDTDQNTKAYEQFDELEVEAGKVYQIAVKETKGTNKMSGKEVTYRNIMFFYTGNISDEPQNPVQSNSVPSDGLENVRKAFKEMENRIGELEVRVGVIEMGDLK